MEASAPWVPEATFREMVRFRRELHRAPELSGQEQETARKVTRTLQEAGLQPVTNVGGHGLYVDVPGRLEAPIIALRADMDALPIEEETGLEFTSTNAGVMHACGHDGHTSMLLGALRLLLAEPPPAPVRLIWQPAEETAAGARAMVADGVLKDVAMIFGGHVDRHYVPGKIAIADGPVNAATDMFEIRIHGQGGHGARPHEALDAVVAGSLLVTSLQTIVSREVNPARPSVVTVGSFHAGTASNVIAGSAVLSGTIRAQDKEVQEHLQQAIHRIALSVGQLHGAAVEVSIEHCTPALHNRGVGVELARQAARTALGPQSVTDLWTANMGGEDFAHFLTDVPGCYVRFGSQIEGLENQPAHSSRFDIDERVLAAGAAWFDRVARVAGEQLSQSGAAPLEGKGTH